MNNKIIARIYRISKSRAKRINHDSLKIQSKETLSYHAPLVLDIDEYSIYRSKFTTTITELRKHRVYDVVVDKSSR